MPLGNLKYGNQTSNPQHPNLFSAPGGMNSGQMFFRGMQRLMPYLSQRGLQFPPKIDRLMKGLGSFAGQGFPQQSLPQQGFPQKGFPQASLRQPGFLQQGFPQQAFPQQALPPQAFPQQNVPPQGYPSQGFFAQGIPAQAYPQGNLNQMLNVQTPPLPQQQPPQAAPPAKGGGIKEWISRLIKRKG